MPTKDNVTKPPVFVLASPIWASSMAAPIVVRLSATLLASMVVHATPQAAPVFAPAHIAGQIVALHTSTARTTVQVLLMVTVIILLETAHVALALWVLIVPSMSAPGHPSAAILKVFATQPKEFVSVPIMVPLITLVTCASTNNSTVLEPPYALVTATAIQILANACAIIHGWLTMYVVLLVALTTAGVTAIAILQLVYVRAGQLTTPLSTVSSCTLPAPLPATMATATLVQGLAYATHRGQTTGQICVPFSCARRTATLGSQVTVSTERASAMLGGLELLAQFPTKRVLGLAILQMAGVTRQLETALAMALSMAITVSTSTAWRIAHTMALAMLLVEFAPAILDGNPQIATSISVPHTISVLRV